MKKRILVAEPDPDVRTLLEIAVRRAGHDTTARAARDSVDAIVMEPGCAAAGEATSIKRQNRRARICPLCPLYPLCPLCPRLKVHAVGVLCAHG